VDREWRGSGGKKGGGIEEILKGRLL